VSAANPAPEPAMQALVARRTLSHQLRQAGGQVGSPTRSLIRPPIADSRSRWPKRRAGGPGLLLLVAVDGNRCVSRLVWIDTDHDCHRNAFRFGDGTVAGTPDSGRCALASFEPRHSREIRPGDQLEKKPTPKWGRQAPSEPTGRTSQTLRKHRNAHPHP